MWSDLQFRKPTGSTVITSWMGTTLEPWRPTALLQQYRREEVWTRVKEVVVGIEREHALRRW